MYFVSSESKRHHTFKGLGDRKKTKITENILKI